ncbi:hypothetical protein F0562_010364 [Nyssa sinensis]|uniref:Homeobox-leucine zipper protein n=1 Tax=Nyssa sinensis TaxID=561372 RepID=A0A5J5A3F5_9ASTE|nr:hypothetical protein F0562_010364 [Nyssa sinensis]
MSFFSSQNQKHCSPKDKQKRLTEEQVRLLEASFISNKKLETERKLQLARELGIPPRQIAIWYQNKRARWKTQNLELDYNSLQLRFETALTEKRRLERDVERLRGELEKAQELLLALNQSVQLPPVSSLSSCRDDHGGSSSLHDDHMGHTLLEVTPFLLLLLLLLLLL